jgi:hypothetical protein
MRRRSEVLGSGRTAPQNSREKPLLISPDKDRNFHQPAEPHWLASARATAD